MNPLYKKLAQARKEIRESAPKKAGRNDYSKYDYFTPEQVEVMVSEACERLKMLPLCSLKRDEHGLYQEMLLVDLESENDIRFKLATAHGELKATNQTQQMGGTDTYSERYLKMKVFQIKDNNLDHDAHNHTGVKAEVDDILG